MTTNNNKDKRLDRSDKNQVLPPDQQTDKKDISDEKKNWLFRIARRTSSH